MNLVNEVASLVGDRVKILTQGTGWGQTQPQILQPPIQGHGFFLQQSRVLIFATPKASSQHDKQIYQIRLQTWAPDLQLHFGRIDLAQLDPQLGQIRRLSF